MRFCLGCFLILFLVGGCSKNTFESKRLCYRPKAIAIGEGDQVAFVGPGEWGRLVMGAPTYVGTDPLTGFQGYGDAAFVDRGLVLAVGGGETILRSQNAGSQWEPAWNGRNRNFLSSIAVTPNAIFVGGDHALLRSDRQGLEWKSVDYSPRFSLRRLHFFDDQHGWALAPKGLYETRDGGAHWEKLKTFEQREEWLDMHVFDQQTAILTGQAGKVALTEDGGAGWREETLEWPVQLQRVEFVDRQHGYIAATDLEGGTSYAFATDDGGQTWPKIFSSDKITVLDLAVSPTQVWMVGDNENRGVKYMTGLRMQR